MNPNHFRRIDKKFLFGFAALAIAGLCLWRGGLFSAETAAAARTSGSAAGYISGNTYSRSVGGRSVTYIRYQGVRSQLGSSALSSLMRAASINDATEGESVSMEDFAMIVATLVDPYFTSAPGSFVDNFTKKLVEKFGDGASDLAKRLTRYYDDHPVARATLENDYRAEKNSGVNYENIFQEGTNTELDDALQQIGSDKITVSQETADEIAFWLEGTPKGGPITDPAAIAAKLRENGIDPNDVSQLEAYRDAGVNIPQSFIDTAKVKAAAKGTTSGEIGASEIINTYKSGEIAKDEYIELIEGNTDLKYDKKYNNFKDSQGVVDVLATEVLTGHIVPSDDSPACQVLGGMDPDSPTGMNEGTGLLDSGSTPSSSNPNTNPNPNTNTNTNTNTNVDCASYSYSAWSVCAGGQQTRTITGQSPAGCTNTSSAILTQPCTVSGDIACTAYDYSAWSVCAGGQQTRTITGQSPAGCTDTSSAMLTQPCTVSGDIACTAYDYSAWGACAGGQQTRTITGQSPSGCTATSSAELVRTCVASCVSYTYSEWSACVAGRQTRAIVSRSPEGCDAASAMLEQTCLTPCVSYDYGDWSACVAGQQTRAIISRSPENCDASSAVFTQPCVAPESPVVENTTNTVQSDSSAALSVITDRPADCQYNSAGGFSFGTGTDFSATGSYFHNAALANVTAGEKTYYVICKDKATGGLSGIIKIDFRVEASADPDGTCAEFSANDRKNDAQRSWSDTATADSVYLWQSIRLGREESFDKVDWYAGYQFTPQRDGRVNQVCGYFKSGSTNKVSIYNGSYNELASAQISGSDAWKCVDIAPVEIKTDKRYYVIARIEDGPVYLDNKPGMLPRSATNALVEAGIRQSAAEGAFGNKVIKYDHSIFGLVDVRIAYAPETATGPIIASLDPQGAVNTADVRFAVKSVAAADCRFGRDDIGYAQMPYEMSKISDGSFGKKICGLEDGAYTFYVRCRSSAGQENNFSKTIQFNVAQ